MKKKELKYYAIILGIIFILVLNEVLRPKPLDWNFSLEQKDKIPFGTFVLFNTLEDIFPGKEITVNKKTTYQYFSEEEIYDKNIIYITNDFYADELEVSVIFDLLNKGNNVFISSHVFSDYLCDSLHIEVDFYGSYTDTIMNMNFYNKRLRTGKDYVFGKTSAYMCFSKIDTANAELLAFSEFGDAVMIRQKLGDAYIYLNTTPEVFTNYAMVAEKNFKFAHNILNYLPVKDVVWDEYYKPNRKYEKGSMDYIYENPGFKAALIILIVTGGVFVIFTARRRQRVIPIIKPHKNTTVSFVKTIGRLYFHSKNHKDITEKKFKYLHNFMKTKYNIDITDSKNINYEKIAEKTGTDPETIKKVLLTYAKIHKLEKISAEQLNIFNNYIEDLYETCK